MEDGYVSLRKIEKLCKTDIRFMWLLQDNPPPSHMTIDNFMNNVLNEKIDEIFADIYKYIFKKENVDTNHVYIDGTKIAANANKYSWVWKKSCEKNRQKVFAKITDLLNEMNEKISSFGVKFGIREEYAIEYLEQIQQQYVKLCGFDPKTAVRGRGHHKTAEQPSRSTAAYEPKYSVGRHKRHHQVEQIIYPSTKKRVKSLKFRNCNDFLRF